MTLFGLSLAELGLVFAVAGGAVVILYIIKLRRRRVQVPFAGLWQQLLEERESQSLFRRLKRLLSLLVQLLFLALLAAALGDPRLGARVLEGRHLVLLCDTSASMKTRDGVDGTTRMAEAIHRAKQLVRGLNGADSMMILQMDAQVTALSSFSADDKHLLRLLDELSPTDTRADVERALSFALHALKGRGRPSLIVISDGAYGSAVLDRLRAENGAQVPVTRQRAQLPIARQRTRAPSAAAGAAVPAVQELDLRGIDVRYIPVGRATDNIGIVAFSARRYARNKLGFEVLLEVANNTPRPATVDLELRADGKLVDVQQLKLRPARLERFTCERSADQSKQNRWCNIAADGELLEARLVRPKSAGGALVRAHAAPPLDAFSVDDRAYALIPHPQGLSVLLVSRGNLYLEGVLLLDPTIEVTKIAPEAYTGARGRAVDAVIFDRFYPAVPPPVHSLVIASPRPDAPFKQSGVQQMPFITDLNREHPVMRWVTLGDVNIARTAVYQTAPGLTMLAGTLRAPIIAATMVHGVKTVAFGFDITESDLPLRVAFPLLLLNSLDWFAGRSDSDVSLFKTGERFELQLPRSFKLIDGRITVRTPDHLRVLTPVRGGRAVLYGSTVGVYTLEHGSQRIKVAANLADRVESEIAPHPVLSLAGRQLTPPEGFGVGLRRAIWIYLLLAAMVLSLVEWVTYNRRLTV